MKAILKMILFVLLFITVYSQNSYSSEYALAMPTFWNGKCSVIAWIHGTNESRKIEYKGSLDNKLCHVEIPKAEFEADFKYCVLSGVKVKSKNQPFLAEFGGGPAGDRDIYWFEWKTAGEVFPTFYCFYK